MLAFASAIRSIQSPIDIALVKWFQLCRHILTSLSLFLELFNNSFAVCVVGACSTYFPRVDFPQSMWHRADSYFPWIGSRLEANLFGSQSVERGNYNILSLDHWTKTKVITSRAGNGSLMTCMISHIGFLSFSLCQRAERTRTYLPPSWIPKSGREILVLVTVWKISLEQSYTLSLLIPIKS